jgi:hypothetical protein
MIKVLLKLVLTAFLVQFDRLINYIIIDGGNAKLLLLVQNVRGFEEETDFLAFRHNVELL